MPFVLWHFSLGDKTDRPQGNQYLFYGNDVRFSLLPLKLGEEVVAKQSFRACGMDSSPSAPVKAENNSVKYYEKIPSISS